MALNYEVKKKVFGFDQTKTEKYVAQLKTLGIIQFGDLCDEVTKIGMAPRGVVKMVLDGLQLFFPCMAAYVFREIFTAYPKPLQSIVALAGLSSAISPLMYSII